MNFAQKATCTALGINDYFNTMQLEDIRIGNMLRYFANTTNKQLWKMVYYVYNICLVLEIQNVPKLVCVSFFLFFPILDSSSVNYQVR